MEVCAAATSSSSSDEYSRFAIKKNYSEGCENGTRNGKEKEKEKEQDQDQDHTEI